MEENKQQTEEKTKKTTKPAKSATEKKTATKKTTAAKSATAKSTKTKGSTTKGSTAKSAAKTSTAKKSSTKSAAAKKVEEKPEVVAEVTETTVVEVAEKPKKTATKKTSSKTSTKKTAAVEEKKYTQKKTSAKKNVKKTAEKEETPSQSVEAETIKDEKTAETAETTLDTQPAPAEKPKKKAVKKAKEPKTVEKVEKEEKKSKKTKKTEEPKLDYDILEIEGYHRLKLYTYIFDQVQNPKAAILIVHGMQEHAGRYIDFARFLNKNGYIVFANDLRGHGHTAIDKKYGYGEKDIYKETVQDEIILIQKIKEAYNLPVYVFGHSYGSMLSQAIIQNTDLVEKCVLCGTANGSSGIMKAGGGFASFMSLFKGETSPGGMIENMCVKGYGKKFENGNWLSRDEEVFKRYQEDEFCGGSFPFSFYKSMLSNMKKINKGITKIGNKKIFIIAGSEDPVGSKGKQIKSLNKLYLKNNINSRYKIYSECRHELLNEVNREEVYQDVVDFYNE